jgi:hypothetical protein
VNLKSRGAGSGMKIEEYIDAHYVVGTPKVGIQVPIRAINNLSLKIIVLVLTMITGSALLHQESRPLMFYVVQCARPTVYDWCTSLPANMKSQLTECKEGGKINFGFSSILCSFFFERVPSIFLPLFQKMVLPTQHSYQLNENSPKFSFFRGRIFLPPFQKMVLPVAPFFETEVKNATSKKRELWRVLVKLVTMVAPFFETEVKNATSKK